MFKSRLELNNVIMNDKNNNNNNNNNKIGNNGSKPSSEADHLSNSSQVSFRSTENLIISKDNEVEGGEAESSLGSSGVRSVPISPNSNSESGGSGRQGKETGTSDMATIMHLIKGNVGTGVLAIPYAFKNGGLLLGSISWWIIAGVCIHCMHILLKSADAILLSRSYAKLSEAKKKQPFGYENVVHLAAQEVCADGSRVPRFCKSLISSVLIISQLGFCCVYLVFIPVNMKQLVDFYWPTNVLTVVELMCIVLLPLALFCMIKSLKTLGPFSTMANVFMIGSLMAIMYDLTFYGSFKTMGQLEMAAPYFNWPIYFSYAVYSFEGIALVLPVYQGARNKKGFRTWNGTLNTSMMLVAIIYFSLGFYGYLKYGYDTKAVITLNLPSELLFFQIIKVAVMISVFITYNLQFLVASNIIWMIFLNKVPFLKAIVRTMHNVEGEVDSEQMDQYRSQLNLIENLIRMALVLVTFIFAVFVPRIDLFISLIGSIASSTLALIAPPLLDMAIFWKDSTTQRLFKNIAICAFGCFVFLSGTMVSIRDMITFFMHEF